MVTIAVI